MAQPTCRSWTCYRTARFCWLGLKVAIALLWLRRRSLADYDLMLTLVVFAATSTVVCFVDGKNWYYHWPARRICRYLRWR